MFRSSALVASLLILSPVVLSAQTAPEAPLESAAADSERPPIIAASAFAKRSPFSSTSLSPNGNVIATKAVIEGEQYVALIDADKRSLLRRYGVGESIDVQ